MAIGRKTWRVGWQRWAWDAMANVVFSCVPFSETHPRRDAHTHTDRQTDRQTDRHLPTSIQIQTKNCTANNWSGIVRFSCIENLHCQREIQFAQPTQGVVFVAADSLRVATKAMSWHSPLPGALKSLLRAFSLHQYERRDLMFPIWVARRSARAWLFLSKRNNDKQCLWIPSLSRPAPASRASARARRPRQKTTQQD